MSPKPFPVGDKTSLADKRGWQAFVRHEPVRPKPVTRRAYDHAAPAQRRAYDAARVGYHRSLAQIETAQLRRCHAELDSRADGSDRCPPVARTGVMLSGPPNVGKTTNGTVWGRKREQALRAVFGWERTSDGAEFLPVVYGLVGGRGGPRTLMRKLLDFYGYPWKEGWATETLTARFADMVHRCGTHYILLDQLHNLHLSNQSDRQVSAHLKELMDTCPAMFVGIGVGLEHTGLFTEGHTRRDEALAQIGGRFALVQIQPATLATSNDRAEWVSLLRTVEDKLILHHAQPGDLCATLADYVHWRTGGVTGEVMDLLRRGANHAIRTGQERLTEALLEQITLSRHAEVQCGRLTLDTLDALAVDADLLQRARTTAASAPPRRSAG